MAKYEVVTWNWDSEDDDVLFGIKPCETLEEAEKAMGHLIKLYQTHFTTHNLHVCIYEEKRHEHINKKETDKNEQN